MRLTITFNYGILYDTIRDGAPMLSSDFLAVPVRNIYCLVKTAITLIIVGGVGYSGVRRMNELTRVGLGQYATWGPIFKISYDLSKYYRKFIVRSTYDSDLQRA